MIKIMFLFLSLFLASCVQEPKTVDASSQFAIPAEFQDCLFASMTSMYGREMTVVRCPLSATTTTVNQKSPQRSVVIDGVEYVNKDILKEENKNDTIHDKGTVQRDMSQQRQE